MIQNLDIIKSPMILETKKDQGHPMLMVEQETKTEKTYRAKATDDLSHLSCQRIHDNCLHHQEKEILLKNMKGNFCS